MIEAIVPAGVQVSEDLGESRGGILFPEEAAVVADAVATRRDEFAAVRGCARRALARLGRRPAPLLPGPGGAPIWPSGVAGSMTHCAGYRAAAVVDRSRLSSIGIDAEPDEPLPDGVRQLIARPEELRRFSDLDAPGDRLLFSAKEAVYKAWYPLTRRWLDFDEVSVIPDVATRRFDAFVLTAGPNEPRRFTGAWTTGAGLVLTACVPGPASVLPSRTPGIGIPLPGGGS